MGNAPFVARFGGAMLVIGGLICLAFAFVPIGGRGSTRLPVPPSTPVVLPSSGAFNTATLVLYGKAPGERPGDGALGCDVTTPSGGDVGLKVSTLAALGAGDRTVDGMVLQPLATVGGFEKGWLFRCTGPAAGTAQPMFLFSERRRLVPRAYVGTFGVLCLALGTSGLAYARRAAAPTPTITGG